MKLLYFFLIQIFKHLKTGEMKLLYFFIIQIFKHLSPTHLLHCLKSSDKIIFFWSFSDVEIDKRPNEHRPCVGIIEIDFDNRDIMSLCWQCSSTVYFV